jgi:uncharacterized SAM-binding protein YcdF (DUF218 family)
MLPRTPQKVICILFPLARALAGPTPFGAYLVGAKKGMPLPVNGERDATLAIVVLGCAVRLDAAGRLAPGMLARRVDAAVRAYEAARPRVVVASGGRRWGPAVEADAMAQELVARGVPRAAVVRERCSLTTLDNARFTAALLARHGLSRAAIVTSGWHMARALHLFSRAGVEGEPVPADGGRPSIARRLRERLLIWVTGGHLHGLVPEGGPRH